MKIVEQPGQFTDRSGGAFVPTMGALHEGHLSLIRTARSHGSPVVVSIFVNPTQFAPDEDFERYPRTFEADCTACEAAGADIIFAPSVDTMYPPEALIAVPALPAVATEPKLEDAQRPTHFAGVCQVVARLFDLVKPGIAIFGEKDYQQLQVLSAMADQEGARWPGLKVLGEPTIREADGLAMSSRNRFLTEEERSRATALHRALIAAREAETPAAAELIMRAILVADGFDIDYAVARDARTLAPITDFSRPARGLIAAKIGNVRLIDNMGIGQGG